MPSILWGDLETFSTVPISHGAAAYAEESEILLFAYALDDAPAKVWDATASLMPDDLRDALEDESVLLNFHNSFFDRTILEAAGEVFSISRYRDTMVKAMLHSLPGSLGLLSEIFKLKADQAKDKRGKELVQLFTKPRPKNVKLRRATRKTHPSEWTEFIEYARLDVEAMRAIDKKLPKWNYKGFELTLWHLDQQINSRGALIDIDLAEGAIRAVNRAREVNKTKVQEATDQALESATQRDKLIEYIEQTYDVTFPDMTKTTLERRVNDPALPQELRDLLALRLEASTTSASKYKRAMQSVNRHGRLCGGLQFAGASRTGRWAGRIFQPQNLPRPTLKNPTINVGIEAIKGDCEDLIFDDVMRLTSSAVRGVIRAPEGKKLVVADLSNIEGRVLAWLAGEDWKVNAFYDFDNGIGEDLYKITYANGFKINAADVTSDQRQIGKVQELALGYQGGVGAFLTFAAGYNLDLDELTETAYPSLPADLVNESHGFLEWLYKKNKDKSKARFGLSEKTFIVCDVFKRVWRNAHPNIQTWWHELEDTARTAIQYPREKFQCRKVTMERVGAWLRVRLPSGRYLCYPSPQIGAECTTCKGEGQVEVNDALEDCPECQGEKPNRAQISYMGMCQYTRKWRRLKTYGGKLCIAQDTLVLTGRGWVPIQKVNSADVVWDGSEFVNCGGHVCNGKAGVIKAYGAYMTPDHEVLTEQGWKHASQSERYNRATCRLPYGTEIPRVKWEKITVGGEVRLRYYQDYCSLGFEENESEGRSGILRMQTQRDYFTEEKNSRNDKTPCVRSLAINDRSVRTSITSSLEKLRWAGYQSLLTVGIQFRKFLARHGFNLSARFIPRSGRQQPGILKRKLQMGDSERSKQQSQKHGNFFRQDGNPMDRGDGIEQVNDRVSHQTHVYDLINCGPRNRFTIATESGPLIVHNCENITQAVARDVLATSFHPAEQAGYEIVLTVHDELITEAPDKPEFNAEHLSQIMATNPPWAKGLPLAAAGFEDYRYRKG